MKLNLSQDQKKLLGWGITAILLAGISIGLGVSFPVPDPPFPDDVVEMGTTHFTNISAEDITATDDLVITDDTTLTDDVGIGGDLTVTGAAGITGAATVAGTATLNGLTVLGNTALTVTDGYILTPTETVYWLNAAANVTITLGASCTDGQPLVTYSEDNVNVTVADTNVKTNDGGVQVMGQYDNVLWICRTNVWLEVSESVDS